MLHQHPLPEDQEEPSVSGMHAQLSELIQANGRRCETLRLQGHQDRSTANPASGSTFSADLVFQEDGFELWLGSLEDALNLEALNTQCIDAVLNCATEECERECAVFRRAGRGRRRCHARGPSAMTDGCGMDGEPSNGLAALDRDQVRAMASFDAEWYSGILDYNVAFCGIAAADEFGYAMDGHFADIMVFLGKCRAERRKVLVHCIMGINRSSAAVVAFLCCGMGMNLLDAITLTSEKRGYILSNGSFLDQLIVHFGDRENNSAKDLTSCGGVAPDTLLESSSPSPAVACS
eukprot:TRINITY_DN14248_c0_g1_i2.p1 TRINITY_DN14248_c0_g1~~TRINITY_DN14248_c0_g1_i2.p1  ORF type:complete len:292 (-),score=43.73 TRINITY_DN14248_c0_g1_i2:254-1129(-)